MSTYNFIMRNYHAVKEADIDIAGLTVVAGVNGCGKSTIARWLSYVVNVLNNYDKHVIADACDSYNELVDILYRATSISPSMRMEWSGESRSFSPSEGLDEIRISFKALVDRFSRLMLKLRPQTWNMNRKRLSSLFDLVAIEDEPLHEFIRRITEYLYLEDEKIYDTAITRLNRHTLKNWKEVLLDRIDLTIDNAKIDLGFKEDGVTLLGEKDFALPLMLRNAVYINTQEISAALGPSYQNNGDLWRLLLKKSEPATTQGRTIAKMIRKIIGGEVVDSKVGVFTGRRDRLHYVRPDGLDIVLRGAATGIISLSILLQLLENGWITENTMLVIDEPEAHLHPQWIVEYARILVKINKMIGAKILVSTHNPDMLAALQSISEKEGTLPRTDFYLAEKVDGEDRYIYKHLGQEIGRIFDSFNIALERIELYGSSAPAAA